MHIVCIAVRATWISKTEQNQKCSNFCILRDRHMSQLKRKTPHFWEHSSENKLMLKYLSSSQIPPSTWRTQTEHFVEPLTASARHRFLEVPEFLTLQSNIRAFFFILRNLYWQYFLVYWKTAQLTQIAADYFSI